MAPVVVDIEAPAPPHSKKEAAEAAHLQSLLEASTSSKKRGKRLCQKIDKVADSIRDEATGGRPSSAAVIEILTRIQLYDEKRLNELANINQLNLGVLPLTAEELMAAPQQHDVPELVPHEKASGLFIRKMHAFDEIARTAEREAQNSRAEVAPDEGGSAAVIINHDVISARLKVCVYVCIYVCITNRALHLVQIQVEYMFHS